MSEVRDQRMQDAWDSAPVGGDEAPREVHLSEYWKVVVKRRRIVGLSVGVALAASMLLGFLTRPAYRSTVVLVVERDRGSVLDISSAGPVPEYYNPEFLPTQTRLMKSREIAERVVARLKLVENEQLNPKKSGLARAVPGTGKPELEKEADATRIAVAEGLRKQIETTPIRGTSLVELSYTAPSAKLASDVANALADAYIDWNLERRFRVVGQASQFLGSQIEQLRAEVEDKEKQLQSYGRQKDIVSTDPQLNVTLQKLESLNKDLSAAIGDRVSKEARFYELQNAPPESVADLLSGGVVGQLRNDVLRLEREYSEKLSVYKPEWPAMQQLQAQIAKAKQNYDQVVQETVAKARENARTEYLTAKRREESLQDVLRGQKSEAMTLNANAVEYNNLRVEAATKRTLMDTLLKRQSETEVMSRLGGARESNIRVVDRALPPASRYSPSYRKNGLLGLFLGLVAGVGLAFFLEYLDRSIRTPDQVEQILGLPSLGVIPAVGLETGKGYGYGYGYGSLYGYGRRQKKGAAPGPERKDGAGEEKISIDLLPHTHPRSVVAEAYRAFRTALLLSRAGGVKMIVVTSAHAREGKTTTAANLAVVLGQLGKKVLLIDGDLHKPRLHETMAISNRVGLVSVLAEGVDAAKAIQRTAAPGVMVMTSGPTSPNPSVLLASGAMANLLAAARASADYVVVDSPPVNLVADALILSNLADGVVLCVQGGVTPRENVLRARDALRRSGANVLGVLVNAVPEEMGGYGYGGYTYGDAKAYHTDPVS
ncbi:MAG: polysaccharide biosynthesis tyrosine autokinase [Thermoanaerobaculia bacterium]